MYGTLARKRTCMVSCACIEGCTSPVGCRHTPGDRVEGWSLEYPAVGVNHRRRAEIPAETPGSHPRTHYNPWQPNGACVQAGGRELCQEQKI